MKKLKFLSWICLLALLLSVLAPVCAVNYAPEDGEASNEQPESAAVSTDFYAGAGTISAPKVTAKNALLIDMDTGVVYFSREADARA